MKFGFTDFLLKKFNLNNPDHTDPEIRSRCGYLEGWVAIIVNLIIFMIKIAIGIISGSISVIADAVHTASDVVTSFVVIWGFEQSKKPADKEHPFGHGRMENIATLIIAVLLCVVGAEILKNSCIRFLMPSAVNANIFFVVVLMATGFVKEWMARFSFNLAGKINSSTLYADAWHHRSDAVSTALVIMAVIGSMFKLFKLDGIFGGIVAVYIIYTGVKLIDTASFDLLGKATDEDLLNEIKELAESVDGVEGVHDILVHDYGTVKAISLHVEVDKTLDSVRAHQIATTVETKIAKNINSSPIAHIDLKNKKTKKVSASLRVLKMIVQKFPQIINFHGVQISSNESGDFLNLHIVLSKLMNVEQSHELAHKLQGSLQTRFKGYKINIHVEPCNSKCQLCVQSCKQTT